MTVWPGSVFDVKCLDLIGRHCYFPVRQCVADSIQVSKARQKAEKGGPVLHLASRRVPVPGTGSIETGQSTSAQLLLGLLVVRVEVLGGHREGQAEPVPSLFPKAGQQRALSVLCPLACPHLARNTWHCSLLNSWVHNANFVTILKMKGDSVTDNKKFIKASVSSPWLLCAALCPVSGIHSLMDPSL